MDDDKEKLTEHIWIVAAKKHGYHDAARVMLDVLAPIAPIVSQLLFVVQPIAGIFGARQSMGSFANLLDAPDGVEILRQQLNENTTNDPCTNRVDKS